MISMPTNCHILQLDATKVVEHLDSTLWARDLPFSVIETLASYLIGVEVDEGDYIFYEHDRNAFLCFLIRGKVSILKDNQNEEERQLITARAGQSFGEMSLLSPEGRSASAYASEKSMLLVLTDVQFQKLKAERPDVCVEILTKIGADLAKWLRRTSGLLADHLQD